MEQRLISEKDAAEYIGMSAQFLRKSRMEGVRQNRTAGPPFVRIGRSVRYDLSDLEKWIDAHRRAIPGGYDDA